MIFVTFGLQYDHDLIIHDKNFTETKVNYNLIVINIFNAKTGFICYMYVHICTCARAYQTLVCGQC